MYLFQTMDICNTCAVIFSIVVITFFFFSAEPRSMAESGMHFKGNCTVIQLE